MGVKSSGNGNGKDGPGHTSGHLSLSRQALETLGAPAWFVEQDRQVSERFDALSERMAAVEYVCVKGAQREGASAGTKWGSLAGMVISALVTGCLSYYQTVYKSEPVAPRNLDPPAMKDTP